jgi:hypothetical protein
LYGVAASFLLFPRHEFVEYMHSHVGEDHSRDIRSHRLGASALIRGGGSCLKAIVDRLKLGGFVDDI